MEKLQKALSKARKTRDGSSKPAVRRHATPSVRQHATPAPLWGRMAPFVPNPVHLGQNRVMTLSPQEGSAAYDILRTKTYLRMKENGWSRLAITSPDRSCGKTTTVCNLVLSFARQKEVNLMLMDLDLRGPSVARTLGAHPEHEIHDMLKGDVAPEDQMQRINDNVALSLGLNPVSDPLQLLLSQNTSRRFDELQEMFKPDIMLFDLPPMLSTDDSRAMLKNVDCAMIIARSEHTSIKQLDVCEREVSELTNILGVVLNGSVIQSSEEEGYGRY